MTSRQSLLIGAGELLYGPNWQTDIARDLEVNARLVRFWAAGERKTPDGAMRKVKALLARREVEIAAMWEKFEEEFPDD